MGQQPMLREDAWLCCVPYNTSMCTPMVGCVGCVGAREGVRASVHPSETTGTETEDRPLWPGQPTCSRCAHMAEAQMTQW